jgi:sodium/pantothenate symporter
VARFELLLPVILYLAVVYGLAVYSSRVMTKSKVGFVEEYFLGNRAMGGFVLAMTLVATYTSASSFVGGPGVAYNVGLGWVLLAMVQVPVAYFTLGVLGKKFAIVARKIKAVTVTDFLRARYESPAVVIIASVGVIIFLVAAMVAQFIGGARVFEAVTGFPYEIGLIVFAVTVIIYTTVGGFRAVVLTDAVQGVVMTFGTAAILWGIIHFGGGMSSIVEQIKAVDPALLTPFGPNNAVAKPFVLSFWILVGFATVGLPYTAVRCMGYRDSRSMHQAIVIGTFVVGFLMLGMHLSGALSRAIDPNIKGADIVIPTITIKVLPPFLAGIFLAGPLAAIMSTIDSQLILASSAIVKDIYLNYVNPGAIDNPKRERGLKRLSFLTTAIMGIIVFAISFKPPSIIVWINLFALGGLESVFLWPIILGLYWKRANAPGALASMVVGLVSFLLLSNYVGRLWGMHVIVPSLLIALVAFVVVANLTPPPPQEAIRRIWE